MLTDICIAAFEKVKVVLKIIFMCGQVEDDDDVREGEAGRRCALEGDENFEEEAGKVKVIASMRMRIKIMWMSMWLWMRIKNDGDEDEDEMQMYVEGGKHFEE